VTTIRSRRPRKTVFVTLPAEEFDVLEQQASQVDRDAWQHARHLIRRGLGLVDDRGDPIPGPEAPVEAAS
jgi:hypothetical protein